MTDGQITDYEAAIAIFESISDWRDAEEQIYACQEKIEEIKAETEAKLLVNQFRRKRDTKIAIISTLIGCALLTFFILFNVVTSYFENRHAYNDAIALIDEEDYISAYESLIALNGYKDSTEKANSIFKEYMDEKLTSVKVDDYLFSGSYEQDNNKSNGKEKIEWKILEVEDERVLIISKYALDCQPYNTSKANVTWETCTLRQWLNNEFYNTAFSEAENIWIPTTTVPADQNPDCDTTSGNATEDKIFLLSIKEAEKYVTANNSDSKTHGKPTAYALANSTDPLRSRDYCWCWLRSSGQLQSYASSIWNSHIDTAGNSVDIDDHAVLPAMWIKRKP